MERASAAIDAMPDVGAGTPAPMARGVNPPPPPVARRDLGRPAITKGMTFRMRGRDATLDEDVFWNAPKLDQAGVHYGGPGPLADVVVQKTFRT